MRPLLLKLVLTLLVLLLLPGCGSDSSSEVIVPISGLFFLYDLLLECGQAAYANPPFVSGGSATSFSIFPQDLPEGLLFNFTTGNITGTPTESWSPGDFYIITASNSVSSQQTTLYIEVFPATLCFPNYPSSLISVEVGEQVDIQPDSPCGNLSISPPIPSNTGLTWNSPFGVITGVAAALYGPVEHTVVATNCAGETEQTFILEIVAPPLCVPTYPGSLHAIVDVPFNRGPLQDCGDYSISPEIPAATGLFFNPTNGVISGVPEIEYGPIPHTISASNFSGTSSVSVSLTIFSAAGNLPPGEVYRGPQMVTPRYGHTATTLNDGTILIVGGSDERHLTSLDTAEIFDPFAIPDSNQPIPETILGRFLDQDIFGNVITMKNGGRIFHSATLLPDGNVLICGGSADMLFAEAVEVSEIFDVQSREFAPDFLQVQQDLLTPRFRHSATLMPNGKILIVGGQESRIETIIDPTQPPGSPNFEIDIRVFPSLESVEIFDPAALSFSPALTALGQDTELATPLGRAGHTTAALAGFDNILGTNDDVIIHVGGFETLSTIFAPQFKAPWQADTTKMSGLETYDLASGVNTLGQGVVLTPRVNDAKLINAGSVQSITPVEQIAGVNNIILIANGDDDGTCPVSVVQNELLVATFSGFGPSNGLLLSLFSGEFTLLNNNELLIFDPMNCAPFGRSEADVVVMNANRTYNGEVINTGISVTGGGAWIFIPPTGGCAEVMAGVCANEIQGLMFYDPFFNATPCIIDPAAPPFQPWDLTVSTTPINPTGVVGTMLNFDDAIAGQTCFDENADGYDDNYGDGSFLLSLNQPKVLHTLNKTPGPNGIPGDIDDTVVVIGGGSSYFPNYGDEPVPISCEVLVLPDLTQP